MTVGFSAKLCAVLLYNQVIVMTSVFNALHLFSRKSSSRRHFSGKTAWNKQCKPDNGKNA